MPPSSPLLPTLARRLSFGSTSSPAGSVLPSTSTSTSSSSSSSSSRRSISTSAPLAARRPDEWSYPSDLGDNKPRRPFLNPDVSDWIPNEVAIRAGLPPYRQPSASLDVYALPPTLKRKFGILTHTITFTAYEQESLKPYGAMARHAALALLIPVSGPRILEPTLRRWASNSSPFVHSSSKQIFERRTWQHEVDVYDADDKAVEVMVKVLLASGRGEHVKLNVQKYSTGEFLLESTSPTTAPLTHTTKRMAALVQEMADRFVKDEYARLAASKDKRGVVDPEAVRIANIEREERASKGLPPLESDEVVVVPQNLSSTGEGELPAFAGKTQWKKYLEKETNTPQAQARKRLDSLAPSKTLQIFLSNPAQSILSSSSPSSAADANADEPTLTTSLTTTVTPELIPELIRPYLHIRSTFLVSSQPLLKPPTLPTPPESFSPPIHPRRPHQHPNKTPYIASEDVALDYSREVTAKYVALPGEGTYYLVEFGTVEEARRVREELDDRVLGDGTVLDVWFAKGGSADVEGGDGEGEGEGEAGEGEGLVWTEARGVGTEGWKRVEVEKLEEWREVERKRMSGIREHTGPAWVTLGAALDGIKEEEARELEGAASSTEEGVVGEAKESVEENVESTSSTITEKVEETKESIVDTAEEVKETVESKIEEDVKPAVAEKVEEVKDALPSTSAVVEKVEDAKDTVVETAQNVKESVASKIEEVVPTAVEEKVEFVKETIADALPTTTAEVSEKFVQAKEVVVEKVEAVKESAVDVKEKIQPAASSFVEKVAEKIEAAKEVVSEKVEEAKEKVEEVVGGVKEKVQEEKKKVEEEVKKGDETDGSSKP